jgi:pimeloyl-ACP methyl ester carboxylesterase
LAKRLLVLGTLGVVYLVLMFPLGCGRSLANALLLHPTTHDVPAFGAVERLVDTDVGEMQVWVATSPSAMGVEPERFVLQLTGNGGRAERVATDTALRWGDVPTEVWAMNYPGYGGSDGPARLDRLVPAASGVYDALVDQAGDRPIFLDLDSMGTTVGLWLAAEKRAHRPVAGMVLKNPPPLRALINGRFGWWNLWLIAGPIASGVPVELDSEANAARSWCPAIFIQAESDGLVPPSYQDRVIAAYAGPTRRIVLAGADHNTPIAFEEAAQIRDAIHELFGGTK